MIYVTKPKPKEKKNCLYRLEKPQVYLALGKVWMDYYNL
jgi:hypothetical protein